MIKGLLISIYFLVSLLPQQKHADLRHELTLALNSSKLTDSLYNSLSSEKERSPLHNGYLGTVQALKAKHAFNPYFKIKYINEAESTFAKAIMEDPQNIEIRFMRFSMEHSVPGFLGYHANLDIDRVEIIDLLQKKHYNPADKDLITSIVKFLLSSNRCTPGENAYLTKQLILFK